MMVATRDVTWIVRIIRNCLLQRKYKNHLRFESTMSARTQESPCLPHGPANKLAHNYYADRDGRREITPPEIVYDPSKRLVKHPTHHSAAAPPKKAAVPGFGFNWKTGKAYDSL